MTASSSNYLEQAEVLASALDGNVFGQVNYSADCVLLNVFPSLNKSHLGHLLVKQSLNA